MQGDIIDKLYIYNNKIYNNKMYNTAPANLILGQVLGGRFESVRDLKCTQVRIKLMIEHCLCLDIF